MHEGENDEVLLPEVMPGAGHQVLYACVRFYIDKNKLEYPEAHKIKYFVNVESFDFKKKAHYVLKYDPIQGSEEYAPAKVYAISDDLEALKNPDKRLIKEPRTEQSMIDILQEEEAAKSKAKKPLKTKVKPTSDKQKLLKIKLIEKEKEEQNEMIAKKLEKQKHLEKEKKSRDKGKEDEDDIVARKLATFSGATLDYRMDKHVLSDAPLVFDLASDRPTTTKETVYDVKIRSLESEVANLTTIIEEMSIEMGVLRERVDFLESTPNVCRNSTNVSKKLFPSENNNKDDFEDCFPLGNSTKNDDLHKKNDHERAKNTSHHNSVENAHIEPIIDISNIHQEESFVITRGGFENPGTAKRCGSALSNVEPQAKNPKLSSCIENENNKTVKVHEQHPHNKRKQLKKRGDRHSSKIIPVSDESDDEENVVKRRNKIGVKKEKKYAGYFDDSADASYEKPSQKAFFKNPHRKTKPLTMQRKSDDEYNSDQFPKYHLPDYKKWDEILENGKKVSKCHLKFGVSINYSDWLKLLKITDAEQYLKDLAKAIWSENLLKYRAFNVDKTIRKKERKLMTPVKKAVCRKVFFTALDLKKFSEEDQIFFRNQWRYILSQYINSLNQEGKRRKRPDHEDGQPDKITEDGAEK